jgi:hypothetical protein
MQLGSSGEHSAPPLQKGAWERLNLPLSLLPSLVQTLDEQIEAVQEAFLCAARPTAEK